MRLVRRGFNKDTVQVFGGSSLSFPMFWQSGDQVYLKYTRQWGVFARYAGDDMAMVFIDDQHDEIPVHLDDLDYNAPVELPAVSVHPGSRTSNPKSPRFIGGQIPVLHQGVQLALTADPEHMESRQVYAFLINDTDQLLEFSSELRVTDGPDDKRESTLPGGEWVELAAFSLHVLPQQPEIVIRTKWANHSIDRPDLRMKPKPKSLFQKMGPNPYFSFPAALYSIPEDSGVKENLQIHTKRPSALVTDRRLIHATPAPAQKASFQIELDLHAERLFSDPEKVTPGDIFRRQMMVFEQYLQQAIQVGVPHVYIIHGLGKGKLRQAIAQRSQTFSAVSQVRNDYHPKYGFGASEIILR